MFVCVLSSTDHTVRPRSKNNLIIHICIVFHFSQFFSLPSICCYFFPISNFTFFLLVFYSEVSLINNLSVVNLSTCSSHLNFHALTTAMILWFLYIFFQFPVCSSFHLTFFFFFRLIYYHVPYALVPVGLIFIFLNTYFDFISLFTLPVSNACQYFFSFMSIFFEYTKLFTLSKTYYICFRCKLNFVCCLITILVG